jgi:hypothetical protein
LGATVLPTQVSPALGVRPCPDPALWWAGRPHHACLVPVLLATDEALRIGEQVDVRIKPREYHRYDIDDRWYRLTVEPLEPMEGDETGPQGPENESTPARTRSAPPA